MGQAYPVWDTGGIFDQYNVIQDVWCQKAAGMFGIWVVLYLMDRTQEVWKIEPQNCWSWNNY